MNPKEISPYLTEEIHRLATSESQPAGKAVLEELKNNPDFDGLLIGPDGELGEDEGNALRWIQRRVQKIQQRLKNIDKLFTWPLTEDALNVGLEWHASSFLLECWKDEEEENDAIRRAHQETARIRGSDINKGIAAPPTIRKALWWWRVHEASQDLPDDADRVEFSRDHGGRLWAWDFSKDVLGSPIDVSDTVDFLRYKPWKSEIHDEIYKKAISDGRVNPLDRGVGVIRDSSGKITQIIQSKPIPIKNMPAYFYRIGQRPVKVGVPTVPKRVDQ
jgi:hypothetical protein